MKFKIERSIGLRNFRYAIDVGEFHGVSNYTYGIAPTKIKVFTENATWELKQTSWIMKLINQLPILNGENFTPFKMYANGKYLGVSKKCILKPVFLFNIKEHEFELRQHNDNYISLMYDDRQVALLKKNDITMVEKSIFWVKCIDDTELLPWIILFCLFTDIVFYPNERRVDFMKYEKSFTFKDLCKERTIWEP